MILSEQKPFEEILSYLDKDNYIFILGCKGCAEASGTGGPLQVEEMRQKLEAKGKKITGIAVIDFLCQKALVKSRLNSQLEQVKAADSILVMTCGIGVQAVAASINKTCHPACNTMYLGGSRGEWQGVERCMECGNCVLEYTGGLCPWAGCAKNLLNGPCGGSVNGKCEVSPDIPCVWQLIFDRLAMLGKLDNYEKILAYRDWNLTLKNPSHAYNRDLD